MKDLECIRIDVGLCTDVLIATFISNYINKTAGIIWFILGLIFSIKQAIKIVIKNKINN